MKIGLITIHYANSYGGILQAYATQQILSDYGNVEIINYQKKYLADGLKTIRYGKRISDILRTGKDILRYLPRRTLTARFNHFISRKMQCSPVAKTRSELQSISEKYDLLIVGSDQVWNPKILGGVDTNYLLSFSEDKPKISLSSSYGSYEFKKEEKDILVKNLMKFRAISVREESSAKELQKYLPGKDIRTTLDPTLLITAQGWSRVSNTATPESGYILVYLLGSDDLLGNTVKTIQKTLNLKVITINQDPFVNFKCDEHIKNAGPAEFVNYFKNSTFVVTNSFHGTAFAINFNKNFITLPPQSGANRIIDLLKKTKLERRYIDNVGAASKLAETEIDYTEANAVLDRLRSDSIKYIQDAIEQCKTL